MLCSLSTEYYYIYENLEIKQSKSTSVLKQMCCSHKNGILERKTQQTLLFKLKFVSDKHNFPLYREIIIPLIKVTHFTLNFSQYVNFHKTSHHISLCILTVSKATICCKIYMHMRYICVTYRLHMRLQNTLFVTYATIFRCFSDFSCVKFIKY